MGDDIQAIKAGILEIADLFAVNKADRPGAENTIKALEMMQRLGSDQVDKVPHHSRLLEYISPDRLTTRVRQESELSWAVPIHPTVATSGEGIADLVDSVRAHHKFLLESGEWKMREAARSEIEFTTLLRDALLHDLKAKVPADCLATMLVQIVAREIDPYSAVSELVTLR
jgi:LAO/AO transport system kinase